MRVREPRPVCPECDGIVDPKTAVCVTLRGSRLSEDRAPRHTVVGVYCCSDCALDVWVRGYANARLTRGDGR